MSHVERQRSLVGSAFVMASVTTVSRIFGLVREQVRAHLLGTTMAGDAFSTAFIIPNLLRRLVGEGAMTAAFVPVFTDIVSKDDEDRIWHFAESFFVTMTALLALLAIVGVLVAGPMVSLVFAPGYAAVPGKIDLTVFLTRLMFPYITLVGLAAVAQAILNTYRQFAVPAATPILLNLATIGCAWAFAHTFETPATGFAIGVLVGGFLQIAFQAPFIWKLGCRFRRLPDLRHPATKKVLRLMTPGLFAVGIHQINCAVSQAMASRQVEGAVSAIQYSSRILELVLGIFVVSLATVVLPDLSRLAAKDDVSGLASTSLFALRLVAFVTIPATVGTIILRESVVDLLFRFPHGSFDASSSYLTSSALAAHIVGLSFIGAVRLIINVFFALKDTSTPVVAAGVAMVANVALCIALPRFFGHAGIALANSVAAAVQFILLAWWVRRRVPCLRLSTVIPSIARIIVASTIMAACVIAVIPHVIPPFEAGKLANSLGVVGTVVLGASVFIVMGLVLGASEPRELFSMVRRRR